MIEGGLELAGRGEGVDNMEGVQQSGCREAVVKTEAKGEVTEDVRGSRCDGKREGQKGKGLKRKGGWNQDPYGIAY